LAHLFHRDVLLTDVQSELHGDSPAGLGEDEAYPHWRRSCTVRHTPAAMDTPPLATPRLQLTPLTLSDADDLFEAFRDPEVVRYWHEPAHASVEVTRAALAQGLSGGGHWWAIRKPGGPALGMLNYLSDEDATGMGYLLRRDQWRQGLALEAVRAALEWGFETRGLERVELWINSGNLASLALATRLGFLGRGRFRQVQ